MGAGGSGMGGAVTPMPLDDRVNKQIRRAVDKKNGFMDSDIDAAVAANRETADVATDRLRAEKAQADTTASNNLSAADEERKKKISASGSLAGASTTGAARSLLGGGAQ